MSTSPALTPRRPRSRWAREICLLVIRITPGPGSRPEDANTFEIANTAVAATAPDGIGSLAMQAGIAAQARTLLSTPLSGYEVGLLQSGWLSKASAGLAGSALIYGTCLLIGRVVARHRSA